MRDDFVNFYASTKQILLTTHSFNILSLNGDNISKYRVWKVKESGTSLITKLKYKNNQLQLEKTDEERLEEELGIFELTAELDALYKKKEEELTFIKKQKEEIQLKIESLNKPLLFAEDKYIQTYKIAWLKLNNVDCDISNFEQKFEDNAPFCIFPSEGAGNLAGLLKCQNIDCYKNKKVIGLFDFDIEGVAQFDNCHNKSFWKDCQIEGNTLSGIYKRRKDHNCFVAMLLPVPIEFIEYNQYGFVSNFVAQEHLLPKSFLESNNLIEDYILPIPNGPTVYKAKDDKKSEIWKKTFDLTKDDFKNFKILFDTLNQIWSSTDD